MLNEIGRLLQQIATAEDERTLIVAYEDYEAEEILSYIQPTLDGLKCPYDYKKLVDGSILLRTYCG